MQVETGYDCKADIWSFGITAFELAYGHPPLSEYPPLKVLLMTVQNAPPRLGDKKFSKSFKDMVAMCLVKDPKKRPTPGKLLKHSFFKHAKPPELSLKKLLADFRPPLNPVKVLQFQNSESAQQLPSKNMASSSAEYEARSTREYRKGISAWNFDIKELKAQASTLLLDDDNDETLESSLVDNCRDGLAVMGQCNQLFPLKC